MSNAKERIELKYTFTDEDNGEEHTIVTSKESDSIKDYEVCEMFMQFMDAAGYSEHNIYKFFS